MSTALPESPDDRIVPKKLFAPVRMASFWLAVVLPFVHLPILLTGLGSADGAGTFLGLLALNMVTLVIGHGHGPGQSDSTGA
ncbi:hypothetical protein [Haloarchaeobius sp. HRN-SO-5]|uniref:hypothetical protein n=1 Tax=Haloarchaeobius sp. HRN-SO-5 TaxID=3446118 RepID=UPI003EBF01AB